MGYFILNYAFGKKDYSDNLNENIQSSSNFTLGRTVNVVLYNIGFSDECVNKPGKNYLGKTLMKLRDNLRNKM